MSPLEVALILQDHCLPQTTITEQNFIQEIFSTLSNLKISSRFHQTFILSLKGGVRDILAHQHRPNSNSTLCASQVSNLYQKSPVQSRVQSIIYTHVMIHCNTGSILYYNILLMQPFRVSFVDVSRQTESRNPRVLLYFILYAFAFAFILAYSFFFFSFFEKYASINANI